jgi:predicted dehydrogenase
VTARRLRVAVLGVGHLGSIHARILGAHPRAELLAVVDPDGARAREVAAPLGCRALESAEELPDGLDCAVVAVPTSKHEAVAVPLLERGIACLVEKPLAGELAAADRILAAAERGRAALAVGHVERFEPGVRRARELGLAPRFIECHRLATFRMRNLDVGVVHDLMIHDLDLLLHFIAAEVETIDASGGAVLTNSIDIASARVVFRNGARANVTASRVSLTSMRRFRLFSGAGYVSLDFTRNQGLVVRRGPRLEEGRRALRLLAPDELARGEGFSTGEMLDVSELALEGLEQPLQAELDSFLRAVAEQRPPEVSGLDGRAALALAEQISKAIAQQTW